MTSPLIGPTPNVTQNIKYIGHDMEFSTEVKGETVVVHCVQGTHNHGSSKVKLIDRIDYNWEFKYYHGHLVAAHIGGKVFAYGMKGKEGGMVRVTNQETNQRALIKNLKEDIKDLAFAYCRESIILGCVDNEGNIIIYQIEDTPLAITYKVLIHVYHRNDHPHSNYRLIWCPYLPSFDEDPDIADDPEKMFVVLNGSKAQIYNVTMLQQSVASSTTPIDPDKTYEGYLEVTHSTELVDASFSSDGTAIAIASADGFVKFFQLYMYEREEKCLHEWRPHNGAPLSSIIFIDNILEYSAECWKFTITGANNNSELKLWSCESWSCLQTIHFKSDPTSPVSSLFLHVSIDYTGQYVLISDINNRVAYILQLKRFDKEQIVYVASMAQFLLPAPFLSFHILEANTRKVLCSFHDSTEDLYDDREDFDEETEITAVSVKMLVIQPKKFQECNIVFQPEALFYDTLSNALIENVDDETIDEKESVPKLDDLQESVSLLIQQQSSSSLSLMTPGDFTPQGHSSRANSETKSANKDVIDENVENLIDFERPQKENFASGGSSPSREVQEILSVNNSTYNSTQDYFDNLTKLQEVDQEAPQKEFTKLTENLVYTDSHGLWPKIPVVKENEIIKDEPLRKEQLLNTSSEDKSNLQNLTYKVSSLEDSIREQNILLQKLHQDRMDNVKFVEEMDHALAKQQLQIAKMLENFVNVHKNMERESHERLVAGVTQMLTKSLAEKMQQIVSHEMKHVILPAINNMIETYRIQVDGQYAQKLASMDMMLKENVAKAFNSKSLADSLSASVVNIVAPSLEKCYRDIIASSLIPSWERVCGQMFQQINETFTRGTKEYTASVESYMDKQRRVQEKGKDLIVQMQGVSEGMKSNADKLTSALTSEIHKQFNTIFKTMQDKLTQNIKDIVSEQVKQGFKNHASVIEEGVINAVRSRAVTPSPNIESHMTVITQIKQFLARGNYDEAFDVALNAENLGYVIFVCEQVDVQMLFGEECKLKQTCLLALIQQLSVELHKQTDLKLRYIQGAFLAISPNHITTKHFMPKLLKDLLKQLNYFIASNPIHRHLNEAKLLKIGVEGMLVQYH